MKHEFLKLAAKYLFILWLLCVLGLILAILISTNLLTSTIGQTSFGRSSFFLPIFGSFIILGGVSFGTAMGIKVFELILIHSRLKSIVFSPIFIIFSLLFIASIFLGSKVLLAQSKNNLKPLSVTTNTSTPTTTPTSTPYNSLDDVKGLATSNPAVVNNDPIVTCTIPTNCGGGTRQLKKSECDQSICCQIGNNSSIFPSKSSCTQAQNNYNTTTNDVKHNPPCIVYYPTLHTSITYSSSVSHETCVLWQAQANTVPTFTPPPTPQSTIFYQPPPPDYATLLRNCIAQATSEYNSVMAYLGTVGAGDSSAADAAETARDGKYQQCQNQYGN